MFQSNKFSRGMGTGAHLAAYHLDPVHDPGVETVILTQRVVDPAAAFDHAGQDVVNVGNRESIVQPEPFDGSLWPRQEAIPQFLLGMSLLAEQHGFTVLASWDQYQHRFRLAKPGQILKITVLTKRVQYIPVTNTFRRRRYNRNAVRSHQFHQLAATIGKIFYGYH